MREHRNVEVRAVAPDVVLLITDPVTELNEPVFERDLGLMEHSLRSDALLEPPDEGVFLNTATRFEVRVDRD